MKPRKDRCLLTIVRYTGGGKQIYLQREEEDRADSKDKAGRGYPNEAQQSEKLIYPSILFDRRQYAQSRAEENAEQ